MGELDCDYRQFAEAWKLARAVEPIRICIAVEPFAMSLSNGERTWFDRPALSKAEGLTTNGLTGTLPARYGLAIG